MAFTVRGQAILKWGTFTVNGVIVVDEEIDKGVESFQIEDEEGHIVTDVTDFGKKDGKSYNFLPKSTAIRPEPGAIFSGPNNEKMIVRSVRIIRSRKMPEMWRLSGEAFPQIAI